MTLATTVRLGDYEVTRIGLGTNRLTRRPQNIALIREAVAAGVHMIDTAHLYTGGQSEETIGAALPLLSNDLVVATKGGYQGPGRGRPEVLHGEIEESFRRLRIDVIPLYYLHRVDPITPIEESLSAIKEYQDRGRIKHIGISQVGIDLIERARKVVPIAAVQNHYNISEREHDAVVDYCAAEGIVFVPFYPLGGDGGRSLADVALRHRASPAQIVLAWLLKRSPVMLPIPGTLSLAHLKENLGALKIELTEQDLAALA